MNLDSTKALVVLSGGQDSTTCLFWAIHRFGREQVSSLTFDYGQRHNMEIDCAQEISQFAQVDNTLLPIDTFAAIGGNALVDDEVDVSVHDSGSTSLPSTFVPGRNLVFLTFAAAFAYNKGIRHLVTGVAQTDYSGYPDCREGTIRALQTALRLGMESDVEIHAPLMNLTKADTILMAQDLGVLPALAMTHTCYNGVRPPCGQCPACLLRAAGFREAGLPDPLLESA
jgi:7-cyano-7-deazaguanine synthase